MKLKDEQEFLGWRSRRRERTFQGGENSIFKGKVVKERDVWGRNEEFAMEGRLELWERRQEVDLRPGCRRPWVPSEGVWAFSCGKQEAIWRS